MKNDQLLYLSDEEIINHMSLDNSNACFDILYSRYYQKVFDKCLSLVKNKSTAKELADEVFSKILEKLHTFKHLSSFSSWIYSITYNHCIDYLRARKNMHYPNWSLENKIPEIIDESEEPVYEINYENLQLILELIHPEEKALLLMKYMDKLSMKQISSALRISEDAAKMRLKRARTRVIYLYSQKFLKT